LRLWQGLGYNRRALLLQRSARIIVDRYNGIIPVDIESLKRLPGIGGATAGAIRVFAFNKPSVFIETNIRSVFIDYFFKNRANIDDADILSLIERTLDPKDPRTWYYALMDYGAELKRRYLNPNRKSAHYKRQSRFKGSDRQIRGRVISVLIKHRSLSYHSLISKIGSGKDRVKRVVGQLQAEGLIRKEGMRLFV